MAGTDLPPPPCGLRLAPSDGDTAAVDAADRAARHWVCREAGALRPGTAAHTQAVTRMFRETFNPYKPTIIDWPLLDPAARDRLVTLPIWNIAVQTEGRARVRMLAYGRVVADPDWRDAIALNGWEEGRHKTVLSNLVASYGIVLEKEPDYAAPRHPEWAFIVTGFSECIDSFFAFGLFALAKRSGFFPPELVETFEPVMQEECRHILLFANWLAWHRCTIGWMRRPWFEIRVAAAWLYLAWERIGLARGMGGREQDKNFTMTGSKAVSDGAVGVPALMALCLAENDRRFAGYDRRLRRPTTLPAVTRLVLRVIRRRRPVVAGAMR